MSDNDDLARGIGGVPPADEVPDVRRRITCASVGWACPLTGQFLECHRHLEVPNRKDCFNCGYTWGYETCQVELDGDGDEGE